MGRKWRLIAKEQWGFLRLEATGEVAHPALIGGEREEVKHWR